MIFDEEFKAKWLAEYIERNDLHKLIIKEAKKRLGKLPKGSYYEFNASSNGITKHINIELVIFDKDDNRSGTGIIAGSNKIEAYKNLLKNLKYKDF
jgi:restriction endonuclease S subunit